jgi:anti-anti-sigma factor
MEVTKKSRGQFVILGIKGSLDMNNVKYIKKIFDDTVDSGINSVAIDMGELNYIDSSGIGSFIGLMTKLKGLGGSVVLLNMKPDIERIFAMTKLLAFFKVFKTEEEFLQSIGVV